MWPSRKVKVMVSAVQVDAKIDVAPDHLRGTNVQLPIKTLSEDFKVAKSKLHMMLRDSKDKVVRGALPDVRTGRKLQASVEFAEAESSLRIQEIVGATQHDQRDLGHGKMIWWSQASDRQQQDLVEAEVQRTKCPLLQSDRCKTFGSGVFQPFKGSEFYVRSNCPFTLIHFSYNRVECDISVRRGDSGLLIQVEIIINVVRTVLQNGSILVEEKSVSLPYAHTYQHIFRYGIYTKLKSSLLPLSVTWHDVPGGIDTIWVELEQEVITDMRGLCGKYNVPALTHQGIDSTRPLKVFCGICSQDVSRSAQYTLHENAQPTCPGDLVYKEIGTAFVPSCSNPNPIISSRDITSSCVCPDGKVLYDHSDGLHCLKQERCPCEFAGRIYLNGDTHSTKCQSCKCDGGKWRCSENICPMKCLIEGQFVTTFDGKQYAIPGKCKYVALQGFSWTVIIEFSKKDVSLKTVVLQHFKDKYTFRNNMVTFRDQDITVFHRSDHAQVLWQSSMYVQVYTTSGMTIQVQMFPEIQLYISVPKTRRDMTSVYRSGLCGNGNSDSTDDFTSSSGIIENSAEPFALSWSLGACGVDIPTTCIKTDNEIFADEKCSVLTNSTGIFAKCHGHIPPDQYLVACIQRTCNCGSSLQRCLCVSLGSYAKVCASLGILVGDWRKDTNCTLTCPKNQEFSYSMRTCNHTCCSLSGPDISCDWDDDPVEGCGCPEGTYLNEDNTCTLKITTTTCESGCYCPQDQYDDHHGNCVSLDNCTCLYRGKVFAAGQYVKSSCKKCVCDQGQWHCQDEPCPGTCQVYGIGHYQTFDSKWYRFSGHCQYTLVEDYCGSTRGTFSVRVESVPCCEEILTCSRTIVLDLKVEILETSPMDFGNNWKAATPPCSDVTTEIFPCDRNSYCSAWAQRRCMILKGDTFKECHLRVDPNPYYQACLLESCSCEFEGKFLGYCTAVAAYAEACSDQNICINWRTPELCPIYCDYYNKPGQNIWHYNACGKMQTCGNYITHRLEVCGRSISSYNSLAPPPHAGHILLWDGIPSLNQEMLKVNQRGCTGHSSTYSAPNLIPQVFRYTCDWYTPGIT
ncbi:mucin-19 [Pholidichthys leucotaenia]